MVNMTKKSKNTIEIHKTATALDQALEPKKPHLPVQRSDVYLTKKWFQSQINQHNDALLDFSDAYNFCKSFYDVGMNIQKKFNDYEKTQGLNAIFNGGTIIFTSDCVQLLLNDVSTRPNVEHILALLKNTKNLIENYHKIAGLKAVELASDCIGEDNTVPYAIKKEAIAKTFEKILEVEESDLFFIKSLIVELNHLIGSSSQPNKKLQKMLQPTHSISDYNLNDAINLKLFKITFEREYHNHLQLLFEQDQLIQLSFEKHNRVVPSDNVDTPKQDIIVRAETNGSDTEEDNEQFESAISEGLLGKRVLKKREAVDIEICCKNPKI